MSVDDVDGKEGVSKRRFASFEFCALCRARLRSGRTSGSSKASSVRARHAPVKIGTGRDVVDTDSTQKLDWMQAWISGRPTWVPKRSRSRWRFQHRAIQAQVLLEPPLTTPSKVPVSLAAASGSMRGQLVSALRSLLRRTASTRVPPMQITCVFRVSGWH